VKFKRGRYQIAIKDGQDQEHTYILDPKDLAAK
jgi:hypothetical protein